MNGLLDFLKGGYNNSVGHLNDIENSISNSIANQPQRYDPHANAQALMGGTSMNAQPQSLIGNTPQTGATNPTNQTQGPTTTLPTQLPTERNPLMNPGVQTTEYQQPIGPGYNGDLPFGSAPQQGLINPTGNNVNLGQTSETYGSGYAGTPTEGYKPINTMGRPDYGVAANPNDEPEYETLTDEVDYAATTNGYQAPSLITGGAFNPIAATEEEKAKYIRLREEAKARLPWYLGGTGGK